MAIAADDTYSAPSGATVRGGRTTLPAWVAALPLWTWGEVPNSKLSDLSYTKSIGSVSSRISAWCGAALKRQGSVYIIGAAGGHADYAGNEVTALTLNSETPEWTLLRGPSADADVIDESPVYLDGRRSATHTYYCTQFINQLDKLVVLPAPGMGWPALKDPPPDWPYPWGSGVMCAFDMGVGDWDEPTALAPYPGGGDFTACLVIPDPTSGDILYARNSDGGKGWKYTRATNSWAQTPNLVWAQGYAGAALDPTRGRALVVGSFSGTLAPRMHDFDTGAEIAVSFGGLGAAALKLSANPGVVYDVENDWFLLFYQSSGLQVLRVDAATLEVAAQGVTGAVANRPNGVLNAIQYVPELKGVVIANSYTENVKFMRTA